MDKQEIKNLLKNVLDGKVSVNEATEKLKFDAFEDLGFVNIDYARGLRQGVAEVIFGQGKNAEQILIITQKMIDHGQKLVLITRIDQEKANYLNNKLINFKYYEKAKIGIAGEMPKPNGIGKVVVATAGTSDMSVAEETAVTLEALGNEVVRIYDVGVSGIHRLLSHTEDIMSASVVVAIAGMEGALASVIGGLCDCPVIAVPTSVGYGAAFGGITALLSMLNSCASGVSVVNIDNGFGAGYQASMINHMEAKK